MTDLDARVIPIIQQALAQYGKTATFSKILNAFYNPLDGGYSEVTSPVDAKITPPAPWSRAALPGTTLTDTTMEVFTFPGFEPVIGMSLSWDGDGALYRVVGVEKIYSGELVCLYGLMLDL